MSTLTITDFLEARISEDEAAVHSVRPADVDVYYDGHWANGITSSARVLAECAAKRAIIMSYRSCVEADAHTNITTEFGVKLTVSGMVKGLELAVKSLAAVYSSHDDYDSGWAL